MRHPTFTHDRCVRCPISRSLTPRLPDRFNASVASSRPDFHCARRSAQLLDVIDRVQPSTSHPAGDLWEQPEGPGRRPDPSRCVFCQPSAFSCLASASASASIASETKRFTALMFAATWSAMFVA